MPQAGSILAVGGAEDKFDKRVILQRFLEEAGGAEARIAIVPTASTIPEKRSAFYQEVFSGLGARESFPVPIASRAEALEAANAELISRSTGVFLTGGDQSRLVSILGDTPALDAIRGRLADGHVVGGTSAAASAFSFTMITGGGTGLCVRPDTVELGIGFGVLPELIIDQHFSQRERLGRLLSAIGMEPKRLGVGIDEDTAILSTGDEIEILGSGQVFILDASQLSKNGVRNAKPGLPHPFTLSEITLHVLAQGDRFDTRRRRLLPERRSAKKLLPF